MIFPVWFLIGTGEIATTFKQTVQFGQFLDGFLFGDNEVLSLGVEFLKPGIEFTVPVPSFMVEESFSVSDLAEKGVRKPRDTREIVVRMPFINGDRILGPFHSVPFSIRSDRHIESSLVFA